jgi:hypothetical protein
MTEFCAGCEKPRADMNKEHVFPKWLVRRSEAAGSGIRWLGGPTITYMSATVPLCVKCNSDFGAQLEFPVSKLFDDLENGRGMSDNEAELLVRWMWKLEGLLWIAVNPLGDYSLAFTLRQRVLNRLGQIRGRLVLAVSRIHRIDESYGDRPLGLDSQLAETNAIFVSGVFSKLAVMVVLDTFADRIPSQFSRCALAATPDAVSDAKLFFPETGFYDDTQAVVVTASCSVELDALHEGYARGVAHN